MTTNVNKSQVKRPATFDTKKADIVVQKVIRENKEWLKEMADK